MLKKKSYLLDELMRLKDSVNIDRSFDFDSELFKKSFLLDGSSTEGNINSTKHIEYGGYNSYGGIYVIGPKIKGKNISVLDMFHDIVEYDDRIKEIVFEYYRERGEEITKDEIDAVFRFIAITLLGLECSFLGED